MKIGILTFHAAHNYGSMLLAFALQESLVRLHHDVKIINLRIAAQNLMYANPLKFTHRIFITSLLRNPISFYENTRKWNAFESFSETYHDLTIRCIDLTSVERIISEEAFDIVIAGGDQIWNMQCSDFSIAYYLPFDIPKVKKISYAPSFGGGGNFKVQNYSSAIKGLLSDFDNISVREQNDAEVISKILNRQVEVVCDPVMLLEKKTYETIAGEKPLIKGQYILYYSPFSTPEKEKISIEYGRKIGMPVYTSNAEYFQCKGMKKYLKTGPAEFLNLVKNAEIVCGNSFHLLAFSLILNKNFIVLANADNRMENLLKRLNISGHFYSSLSEIPTILPLIDWENVNNEISKDRDNGLNYLKKAIAQ